MLEMKITIAAPDLAAAINNLAVALANGNTVPAEKPAKAEKQTEAKVAAQQAQAPVNPMQATGAPLSATPAQTVAPVANVPVAPAVVQQAAPAVAPVAQAPIAQAPVASAVPTGAPTYTLEMIARAGTALVDAGKMDALCGLLAKYGVEALTALDPAQYGNFANDLRALGAQI
ncbi:hypothetical protein [Anaerovibrio slackiae]|uniref:hypothetical protein n=1 Tax=Anaerovibrio slackiae TaxID=2652309 RepID=UPI003867DCD7